MRQIGRQLAQLLLGVILVDTRNFNKKQKKFNDRDLAASAALMRLGLPQIASNTTADTATANTDVDIHAVNTAADTDVDTASDIHTANTATADIHAANTATADIHADVAADTAAATAAQVWFEQLFSARFAVEHLGAAELLRLDYKQVSSSCGGTQMTIGTQCAARCVLNPYTPLHSRPHP